MKFVCKQCNTAVHIRTDGIIASGWPKCCKTLMYCPNREEREELREAIDSLLDDQAGDSDTQMEGQQCKGI